MARGKQIIEEAKRIIAEVHERGNNDPMVDLAITLYFTLGARWADEHPVSYDGKAMLYVNNKSHENGYNEAVNKACEWIEKNVADIWNSPCNPDKIVEDFRKAMKGGEG